MRRTNGRRLGLLWFKNKYRRKEALVHSFMTEESVIQHPRVFCYPDSRQCMTGQFPIAELLLLAIVGVSVGLSCGFLAGLLGVAGAAALTPVLYETFRHFGVSENVCAQLSVGTSLATIAPASIRAYLSQRANRVAIPSILRDLAMPILAGVFVGCSIAFVVSVSAFKVAYVILLIVLAGRPLWIHWSHALEKFTTHWIVLGFGFFVGLVSSLTGTGGGPLVSIFLAKYIQSIYHLVSISVSVGALIGVAGTIGYAMAGWTRQALLPPLSLGFVSPFVAVCLYPASVFAAPYGTRLAQLLSDQTRDWIFGLFAFLVSAHLLMSL
jgi:uncharacterized membrane protein YfcA